MKHPAMNKQDYFSLWLRAVAASAEAWQAECRTLARQRALAGGPTLAEMQHTYETLQACGGGEFDPHDPRPDEDELVDAINQEIFARASLAEVIAWEIERRLYNHSRQVGARVRSLCLN